MDTRLRRFQSRSKLALQERATDGRLRGAVDAARGKVALDGSPATIDFLQRRSKEVALRSDEQTNHRFGRYEPESLEKSRLGSAGNPQVLTKDVRFGVVGDAFFRRNLQKLQQQRDRDAGAVFAGRTMQAGRRFAGHYRFGDERPMLRQGR